MSEHSPGFKERSLIETSLGPPIERCGQYWDINLTDLPIFHGLSVLSRSLGESIVAQTHSDRIDINIERRIRHSENPELLTELGISLVKVWADHSAIHEIADHPVIFQNHLRAIFGTLQRKLYRETLIPLDRTISSKALIFDFSDSRSEATHRFILEYVPSSIGNDAGFLRINIEDSQGRRLDLTSFPHLIVQDLQRRTYIAGSSRIANTWSEGLRREAERGRRSFTEINQKYNHLFVQFKEAGLVRYEQVSVTWWDAYARRLLEDDPEELNRLMKRVLLALEDREIRRLLDEEQVIRILCDGDRIYLDSSHLGRVLNISLGEPRDKVDIGAFLARMPATADVVDSSKGQPFTGIKIFLIHHITAEILGLITALRKLGCRDLVALFIAYTSDVPSS